MTEPKPTPTGHMVFPWRWTVASALIVAAHLLGTQWIAAATIGNPDPALAWVVAGPTLAMLVRWGWAIMPAVFAGALVVAWTSVADPALAALAAAGHTAAMAVAATMLRRLGFDRRVSRSRDAMAWLGVASAAGAIDAAMFLAVLAVPQLQPWSALPATWLGALAWHVLAIVVFGLPLLTLDAKDVLRAAKARVAPISAVALIGVMVATAAFAHYGLGRANAPLASMALVLPPVCLCWLALRHGVGVASSALLAAVLALGLGAWPTGTAPVVPTWPSRTGVLLWSCLAASAALVLLAHVHVAGTRRLARHWQGMLDAAELGTAEWQLATGEHHRSARWIAMLQEPADHAGSTIDALLARVHHDDRARVATALEPDRQSDEPTQGHEVRLLVAGQWRWFDLRLCVDEVDPSGRALHVTATLADVDARRSAQDRQAMTANLFTHLQEGLVVADAQMNVLDANPSYLRITGLAREEVLGRPPSVLREPPSSDVQGRARRTAMWAALRDGGQWVGDVIDRRRNGDPCALHVTVSAVRGPDGMLRCHVLVVSDETEQRLQRDRLERQAHFDELTRLPNRARLGQLLAEAMRSADADGQLLAVCCLDLDHFKQVNERFGHEGGDRLLAEFAIRLRGALRARGRPREDGAARLGGDEFALMLHAGSVDEARAALERVMHLVAQPYVLSKDGQPTRVSASVGVTVYPLDGSDADTLLRHADHAMYGAKQAGRNGYLFFDAEHRRRNEERVLAIGRVQEALDQGELMLYYQPKVDLRRGVVLGCEALLRWNHPDQGVVSPAQFLPLIEHTGLSASIGDHVLSRALDQLALWRAQGLDLTVSVNITARHLQEPDFVQRLMELLARHERGLGPHLELEMLETAALSDIGLTSSLLERCARMGVRWALDDFGTGYSTLTYLKRLPVQVLKIDRSFVQHMLTDTQDKAIVEGVISLARTFDCVVVAEGVESVAQARMLLDMGCDVGQGEGIAAPMPPDQLADWIRDWRGLFALAPIDAVHAPRPG